MLDETDLTGSITNGSFNEYVYFNGERVARRDSSNDAFYYVNDQVGSARSIAEVPAGTRTATLCFDTDYTPFGNQRSPIVSSCTTNYKFTGKERDTESNLDNFEARYKSSTLGRFMSPDPGNAGADSTNPQTWNMYGYVLNNPLAFTDPTGLGPCDDDPTCEPGTGNGFGYGTFPQLDSDLEGPPQQNGQDPLVAPAPTLPLGTSGTIIEVVTNLHLDFCQTSDQACAQELRRIRDAFQWGKVFAKSFFSPSQMVKTTYRSFADENGCNRLMAETLGEDLVGVPSGPGARDLADNAEGAAFATGLVRAGAYSFNRGLIKAGSSSTYRAIRATSVDGAELAGKYAVPVLVVTATADAVLASAVAASKGECH